MTDRPGKCPACGGKGNRVVRGKYVFRVVVPCFVCKRGIIWVRFAP